jgi:hypothetical protein
MLEGQRATLGNMAGNLVKDGIRESHLPVRLGKQQS